MSTSKGVARIARERARQISEEGMTPEADREQYTAGELALAAMSYACPTGEHYRWNYETELGSSAEARDKKPNFWPWPDEWWKPGDRLRELEKAGALIASEIDRMDPEPLPIGPDLCEELATKCVREWFKSLTANAHNHLSLHDIAMLQGVVEGLLRRTADPAKIAALLDPDQPF